MTTTTIIAGMTSAEFITAINFNFKKIDFITTVTEVIVGMSGADCKTNINNVFAAINTKFSLSNQQYDFGITGAALISLLNGNYNELDDYIDDVELDPNCFDNGKLAMGWDGNIESCMTGLDTLRSNGKKGTVYVVSDYLDEGLMFTSAQLVTQNGYGMDLQCHSKTHTNFTELTEVQLLAELQDVNDTFTALGIAVPRHTAYPNGTENATVRTRMANSGLRDTGRSFNFLVQPSILYKNIDKYSIDPYWIDEATNYDPTAFDLNKFKEFLFNVQRYRGAVLTISHGCSNGAGLVAVVSITHLQAIIDYANAIGVDIITHSQLYALLI